MSEPADVVHVDKSLSHLMPLFFDNRRQLLDEAAGCCAAGDLERLRAIGPNFKGACGSYGFHRLSALGEQLQNARHLDEAGALVRQMRTHLDQVDIRFD